MNIANEQMAVQEDEKINGYANLDQEAEKEFPGIQSNAEAEFTSHYQPNAEKEFPGS